MSKHDKARGYVIDFSLYERVYYDGNQFRDEPIISLKRHKLKQFDQSYEVIKQKYG